MKKHKREPIFVRSTVVTGSKQEIEKHLAAQRAGKIIQAAADPEADLRADVEGKLQQWQSDQAEPESSTSSETMSDSERRAWEKLREDVSQTIRNCYG